MKNPSSIVLAVALSAVVAGCAAPSSRTAQGDHAKGAAIRLFNGKDLGNFYTYLEDE